jgi:hypothetical protein
MAAAWRRATARPSEVDRLAVAQACLVDHAKRFRDEDIVYLSTAGLDPKSVASAIEVERRKVFRFGDGAEWRNGRWIEKATGRPCVKLSIGLHFLDAYEASVAVMWSASSLGAEGWGYRVKKWPWGWRVASKKLGLVS